MSPIPDPSNDPDKETDITNIPTDLPPFITVSSSSESEDDDENDLNGYQQLPQEPVGDDGDPGASPDHQVSSPDHQVTVDDVIKHELSSVDSGLNYSAPSLATTLGLPEEGLPVTESVWKEVKRRDSGPLEQEQAEKIKAAMAGFQLPSSQTPEWAKDIPEDVWKTQLNTRLNLNKDTNR